MSQKKLRQGRRNSCAPRNRYGYIAEHLEPRVLLAATLVKDLTTYEYGSSPSRFVELGNQTIFIASFQNQDQLWKTDGTEAGTTLIKDNLGFINSQLVRSNNLVYFTSNAGELWESNGTNQGTFIVKHLAPGPSGTDLGNLTDVNGTLFFTAAYTSTNFLHQLYKTDGTEAGTTTVGYYPAGRDPSYLTNVNGTLYFADDGPVSTNTGQLWKTDGTDAGTVAVKNSTSLRGISEMAPFKAGVIFTQGSGAIWTSDGTAQGTILVRSLQAETTSFVEINGTAFFGAQDFNYHNAELWKTDGTAAGTVRIKEIRPGTEEGSNPGNLIRLGDTLLFQINPDFTETPEFWKTDGTDAGTVPVTTGQRPFTTPVVLNGIVYFRSYIYRNYIYPDSDELWRTDGTAAGTSRIIGGFTYQTLRPYVANGKLFLGVDDHVNGQEPWISDGTPAGTRLLKNIVTDDAGSNVNWIQELNGSMFFTTDAFRSPSTGLSSGTLLWKSDGTAAGTSVVYDFSPFVLNDAHAVSNGYLYLSGSGFDLASGFYQDHVWKTDGTAAGTISVANIHAIQMATAGNKVVLNVDSSFRGIWVTDGTDAGTVRLNQANPYSNLITAGNLAYFIGPVGVPSLYSLFATDGTPAGTVDLLPDKTKQYNINELKSVDGIVYFRNNFSQLWRSQGTPQTTQLITNKIGSNYNLPIKVGNLLLISQSTGIWKTDGTDAGTVRVNSSGPVAETVAIGSTLYYTVIHSTGSLRDLWKTDGTSAGSVLLVPNIDIHGLFNLDETLFLYVGDNDHGWELWKTDGTPSGTALAQDFYAGPTNGFPTVLGNFKGDTYLMANTPGIGRELYRVTLPKANAGGPYVISPRSSISLSAAGSIDPDPNETLSYLWDLDGDGIFGETGANATRGDEIGKNPTFLASDVIAASPFPITLKVNDSFGLVSTSSTTVTIAPSPTWFSTAPGTRFLYSNSAGGDVLTLYNGQLSITSGQSLAALDIQGGRISLGTDADRSLTVGSLTISQNGQLDLGAGSLIIRPPAGADQNLLNSTSALLRSGRNGGTWDGPGIMSSAIADSDHAVGLLLDNQTSPAALRLTYTLIGDLNLDRQVTIADFIVLSSHFNQSNVGWSEGDFNADGIASISDLIDLASHFGQSLAGAATPISPQPALSTGVEALLDEPVLLASPDRLRIARQTHHRKDHRHHRSPRLQGKNNLELLLPGRY